VKVLECLNDLFEWGLLSPPPPIVITSNAAVNEDSKDLPLSGQINRFGPAKAVLRIIGNELAQLSQDMIELNRVTCLIANGAPLIKSKLQESDRHAGLRRGKRLSVGFPDREPKSQKRFIMQYVGRLRSTDKRVEGIQGDLAFVSIREESDGSVRIGITPQGLTFSMLPSPLIDHAVLQDRVVTDPFSDEEAAFLLKHISAVRPGEFEFLKVIAQAIAEQKNTFELVNHQAQGFLNAKYGRTVTRAVAKTMASCAVSKLAELDCIGIGRVGKKSRYHVSTRCGLLTRS